MLLIAWAALGGLVGLGLERVGRWLARASPLTCQTCRQSDAVGGRPWRRLERLRQPCPACGSRRPDWLASLAPAGALVFAIVAALRPLGPELLALSGYAAVLLLVAVLDLRDRLVYPWVIYPATFLAAILTPLALAQPIWSGAIGALAGATIFLLFHFVARLLYREGDALGFGDVMIAGLIGAMAGFPGVGGALLLGTVLGGLGAALVGLVQRSRRAHFAYGPVLCLGAFIALLSGR